MQSHLPVPTPHPRAELRRAALGPLCPWLQHLPGPGCTSHAQHCGPEWAQWRSLTVGGWGPFSLPVAPTCFPLAAISVYTNGTVFATDTNISFEAITKERMPLEFEWHFGDKPPMRTTSSSVRRRLSRPGWYVRVWQDGLYQAVGLVLPQRDAKCPCAPSATALLELNQAQNL